MTCSAPEATVEPLALSNGGLSVGEGDVHQLLVLQVCTYLSETALECKRL